MPKKNEINKHPVFKQNLTFSQKASDKLTEWVGSWKFILGLFVLMGIWMSLNVFMVIFRWDPYPFILLNFVLSCLAAVQAPIILMSQNRQAERDRINFRYDYTVNRKAEREIVDVKKNQDKIMRLVTNFKHDWEIDKKAEMEIARALKELKNIKGIVQKRNIP